MPDAPAYPKRAHPGKGSSTPSYDYERHGVRGASPVRLRYAELRCQTNFSFLRGASHPEELAARAKELGYAALAITDRNTLAGVVRMHAAAKACGLKLIVGAEITPVDAPPILLYATDRAAYGRLCRIITDGRRRTIKGSCQIRFEDIARQPEGLIGAICGNDIAPSESLHSYRDVFGDRLYLAASVHGGADDDGHLAYLSSLAKAHRIPLLATQDVHYHEPKRRFLQDVVTCIREHCTLESAGARLFANAERSMRSPGDVVRRFAKYPDAVARTMEIAERCTFSMDELRYEYPEALCPVDRTPTEYLAELTWAGASRCYPDEVPEKVRTLLQHELALIGQLKYEPYFLTVWDIVQFARTRNILCQGRGSAANSAVCYCLGITSVDPDRIDLLFERFLSPERNEPPDIDVDFEHERREEVFQYIYGKYGREHAGIVAEVITYRSRSAIRDVGKALGLSLDRIAALAKKHEWWDRNRTIPDEFLREAGFDPGERTIRLFQRLVPQLLGFPRHLSQHVGGFVITRGPLCEMVPIENAAMPDRTFIEWDKDDIDALGILKIDCLALGMLTAIRKCFGLLAGYGSGEKRESDQATEGRATERRSDEATEGKEAEGELSSVSEVAANECRLDDFTSGIDLQETTDRTKVEEVVSGSELQEIAIGSGLQGTAIGSGLQGAASKSWLQAKAGEWSVEETTFDAECVNGSWERGDGAGENIPRSDCVAASDVARERSVCGDAANAGDGAIWVNGADASGGRFGSVEHCRRTRPGKSSGVHPVPSDIPRIVDGTPDADSSCRGTSSDGNLSGVTRVACGDGPSASGADSQFGRAGSVRESVDSQFGRAVSVTGSVDSQFGRAVSVAESSHDTSCAATSSVPRTSPRFSSPSVASSLRRSVASPLPRALSDIPPEDPAVYEMIQRADTVGVFQIESRAQMSMLPRLKPRNFYDLVIEVAIVRPGPIQGGMVHPYLRRRNGEEPVTYPNEAIREVLHRTLGVPLFQEQAMRLAVVAAGFTPGEADQLRRAMAAWRRHGDVTHFRTKLINGMKANGLSEEFAERCYNQICGFGEYGFPESHAASFALLVYVSAWLKRHHPAAFSAAILNSLPMGFYQPAQLVRDAREHGVEVLPVDVNESGYDCRLEERGSDGATKRRSDEGTERRREEEGRSDGATKRRRNEDGKRRSDEGTERRREEEGRSDGATERRRNEDGKRRSDGGTEGRGDEDRKRRSDGATERRREEKAKEDPCTWGAGGPALRLGMRLVRGISRAQVEAIEREQVKATGRAAVKATRRAAVKATRRAQVGAISRAQVEAVERTQVEAVEGAEVEAVERVQGRSPFGSVSELARRTGVGRGTLARLAAADAMRSMGLNRREALWQVLALGEEPAMFEGQEWLEPAPELPSPSEADIVLGDYATTGLSLHAHPVSLIRDDLTRMKVGTSAVLRESRHGRWMRVGGVVLVRQRPTTAGGIVFCTLEDECGTANLIIPPAVYEKYRRAARGAAILLAEGRVERAGEVVHLHVRRLEDFSKAVRELVSQSRDFH